MRRLITSLVALQRHNRPNNKLPITTTMSVTCVIYVTCVICPSHRIVHKFLPRYIQPPAHTHHVKSRGCDVGNHRSDFDFVTSRNCLRNLTSTAPSSASPTITTTSLTPKTRKTRQWHPDASSWLFPSAPPPPQSRAPAYRRRGEPSVLLRPALQR